MLKHSNNSSIINYFKKLYRSYEDKFIMADKTINNFVSEITKLYFITKNKKNNPDRIELNKYCKFCKKHTAHKETK